MKRFRVLASITGSVLLWFVTSCAEVPQQSPETGKVFTFDAHMHPMVGAYRGGWNIGDDLEVVTTAAICASWWELRDFPVENFDGSPKGYRIVTVQTARSQPATRR